jgi:hypothetical protein
VLHPRSTYIVTSGYNEPLLMLTAAAFVYLAVRWPNGAGTAIAFLLLPAIKQYVVAPALMCVEDLRSRRLYRPLVAGTLVAAATVAPFLITNPRATLAGIVFQVGPSVAYRPDSISVATQAANLFGFEPWHWLPEVTQLVVGALAFARLRRHGLGGLLLASAIALFASFLLGTQAFVNYYYFIGVLLLLTALVTACTVGTRAT